MTKREKIFLIFAIVILVGLNFFWVDKNYILEEKPAQVESQVKFVNLAGQIIRVDVAETPAELSRGLSGRESLAKDEGMLFIFQTSDEYPFWMKDMSFPIDIIWLGEDRRIVHIEKSAHPESFPEVFAPGAPARYVIEVFAGFSEKYKLKIGDGTEFVF